ncbi:MAG: type II secretion system GspH family protein [Gemmatimonadaceae bacterium]|nr:type II secretion system GspH family protein [Gemmatimonadaceae bacterium]
MRPAFTLVEVIVVTVLLALATAGAVGLHAAAQRSARLARLTRQRDEDAIRRIARAAQETHCRGEQGMIAAVSWAITVTGAERRLTFSDRPDTVVLACTP